ncbi:uncharacterized protein LOC128893008 isoform X6 [Hylaeus anthracinus]|uniref:uncharacterized protein LOC128893008 isoform X6 n=1 Tax=Hylaeus anthracinus TaxID=313031 RepID=UPI0023BA12BE|nr:uncharacterized protein LOC128893008 isoform X6 [Hylaeus anthracinus]
MLGESTSVGRTRWLTRTGDSRAVGSRVLSSSECLLAVARDARDLFVLLLRGRHPGPKWHRKSRKRRTYRKLRRSPERSGNGGPFRTGLPCGGGERRSSNVRSTANNVNSSKSWRIIRLGVNLEGVRPAQPPLERKTCRSSPRIHPSVRISVRLRPLGMRNREYIAELVEQIRRKREIALEERRTEQESCRRHFDTWRRLWGRPGHGAPIDHAHRNNLHNILYRPAIY